MQSVLKPLFSKDELKTFGLNPHDWKVIYPCTFAQHQKPQLMLRHRKDKEIQLSVKLCAKPEQTSHAIETVEWSFASES